MRSTVTVKKQSDIYLCTVSGKLGIGYQGRMAGHTAGEAAEMAAEAMLKYSQTNEDGGDLIAPDEVLELVPAHLRSINADYGWHWVNPARSRRTSKTDRSAHIERSKVDRRAHCDRRTNERRTSYQAMA